MSLSTKSDKLEELGTDTVLIDFKGKYKQYKNKILCYLDLSEKGKYSEAMLNLYYLLREAENVKNAKKILIIDLKDTL